MPTHKMDYKIIEDPPGELTTIVETCPYCGYQTTETVNHVTGEILFRRSKPGAYTSKDEWRNTKHFSEIVPQGPAFGLAIGQIETFKEDPPPPKPKLTVIK